MCGAERVLRVVGGARSIQADLCPERTIYFATSTECIVDMLVKFFAILLPLVVCLSVMSNCFDSLECKKGRKNGIFQ